MKQLSMEKMTDIQGGFQACAVGTGILVASLFSGVGVIWGAAAFALTCLNGDAAQ